MKKTVLAVILMGLAHIAFAAPATLVQSVTYDGETITMQLTRENLRGTNFELLSQDASGGYVTNSVVDERSYLGTVDGYPGAVSCGIQLDDGTFKGAVYFDRGVTWFTEGTSVVETRALDYGTFSNFQLPGSPTVQAGQGGSTMYGYELGVDVDYDYFNSISGGSVAIALEGIEYSVCLVRAIYMRDVLLRPYLGRVIVRSTLAHDPYTGLTQGSYLDAVRLEWENNQTDTNPDVVAGASPIKIGGGLAWVGTVGSGFAYSVNQCNSSGNFDVVFRHEMGHNWGCSHYVGGSPEGTGIMGGNSASRFSGCEVYNILSHRDSRAPGILDDEGTYTAIELPPYASMDVVEYVQTVSGAMVVDVLANDHDANGQTLSLLSFDGTSANGGTVTQQGQNLVYTAPGAYLGTDYFMYTITDTAGRTASGVAIISVEPNDPLRLYLPLDETSGVELTDYSFFANYAELSGTNLTAASVAGKYANAVNFDGIDDHVWVSGMDLSADTVTITTWIKPAASQNWFSGIVFDRSPSASGLNIHDDGKLRYHWNDSPSSYNWNSELTPPADTWTFVALVIEPTRAIIHMDSGSGFQSATNNVAHATATFGTTYIGKDPTSSSRSYTGAIDDVRIYNYSMSQAELQNVYDGGSAGSPDPFDGAFDVGSPEVRWSPGASATGYEVYIGTNQAAVAGATTGSPEYQGSTNVTEWVFDLQPNTGYFWRIDSVTASTTIPGTVWNFTTGSQVFEYGLIAHWKLDDGAGSTTLDSSLNSNVGTLNGPTWTTGVDNGALSFDGINDSVTFGTGPSLSGSTDLTLSAWINTSSGTEQVILQQRDGGGSGYNGQYVFRVSATGTVHFYIYRDGMYQFSFGTTATVNDGQWHFVSAVRDGTDGHIYIDGNLAPSASASGTLLDLNGGIGVALGRDIRDNINPFNGLIDEVKIFDVAKSGQELADLYDLFSTATNAPTWISSPVSKADAAADVPYSATLAGDASDLDGNPLTFSKVSSDPAWLIVAPNGDLSGTPSGADAGTNSWTVSVTDGITAPVLETVTIVVGTAVNVDNYSFELPNAGKQTNWEAVPGWSSDSIAADSGVETGASATEGSWAGFMWSSDPSIWNLTDEFIAAGEEYTLRIAARDTGGGSSLRIMLYYDNAGSRVTLATLDAALSGSMQEFVLSFDSADVPAAAGKRIGIELNNVASGWVGFDNIRLTRTGAPDTDGDTMPDWWEIDNGLNPLVADSAVHSDSDDYDNGSEYVTDTNPQDGGSYQTLSAELASGSGDPTVRFSSSAGRRYVVEYRDDLTSGTWLDLGSEFSGDGTEMTVSDSSGGSERYYRLRIRLP